MSFPVWEPSGVHPSVGAALASLAASILALAVGSPTGVVAPWLATAAALHCRAGSRRHHERRRLLADLPLFVDSLIQRLKAGGSLSQALRATTGSGPVESHLLPLRSTLSAGLGLDVALRRQRTHLADDPQQSPPIHLLINTIAVLVSRGGPALPSLERLNDTLRSAQWIDSEVDTQAGQATASAMALAALPALFVVGLLMIDQRLLRFYLFEATGAVCLAVAGALSYLGWWWMNRIIRRQQ